MLSLASGVSVQAGPITGTQALGDQSLDANTDDLMTATQFTVTQTVVSGGLSQTGDYVGIAAQALDSSVLNTADLAGFTYGNATYGTFTGNFGVELSSSVANTRVFYVSGNFTPGTDFPNTVTANTASILITLNQNGGAPGAISWSATQNTPSVAPPGVPEPTSMALTGIGLSLIGLFQRFRKRSGK